MKKICRWVLMVLLTLCLALPPWAQADKEAGGGGAMFPRMFNPKTIETLKGEVISVDKATAGRRGVHDRVSLNLKTDKETLIVYLGPDFYLDQQGRSCLLNLLSECSWQGNGVADSALSNFDPCDIGDGGRMLFGVDDVDGNPLKGDQFVDFIGESFVHLPGV